MPAFLILPSCRGSAGLGPWPRMSSNGALVVGHRCHDNCSNTALLRQCILWALASHVVAHAIKLPDLNERMPTVSSVQRAEAHVARNWTLVVH